MEMAMNIGGEGNNSRIGEVNVNRFGSKMEIVEYHGSNDITVRFDSGYIKSGITYNSFKKGVVRNPYDRSAFGIGFVGEGDYEVRINGKPTKQYAAWYNMLARCYDEKSRNRYPTYSGCHVIEEWHNFQNFAKWYEENYYEVDGKSSELDKDILYRGNRLYSPDTCVFVPKIINGLFTNSKARRGDLPVGVVYQKATGKYMARCNIGMGINRSRKHLGLFDKPEEAFEAYKKFKLNYIKEIADDWYNRGIICGKLCTAMHSYTISITD